MLKKLDRQNQIISLIQQGHTINASELATLKCFCSNN